MIYYCLNKSGILDPLLENLYDSYLATCVVYWNKSVSDKISQAPFFSDKWLLVINSKDIMDKNNRSILENKYVDIICEVSSEDEIAKVNFYCMEVFDEMEKNSVKNVKKWDVSREEYDKLMEDFRKVKVLSSYKVTENYLKTYIKWWLFTREGNQYGCKNSKLTPGQRWQKAKELEFDAATTLNLSYLAELIKRNESKLLTVLNLVGLDILSAKFLMNSEEYFPKPKYVTVNNFPLYLFSKDKKKKKDIMNIVYSYRNNVGVLRKSILEWCNTFEEIHKSFVCGELSVKNKDDWFSNNGYNLGINSSFKAKLWWYCINSISLEKVTIIKNNLLGSSFKTYSYIVNLCRREL